MTKTSLIIIGSDHAGFRVKEYIKQKLLKKGYRILDVGTSGPRRVDYPDYAEKVAVEVRRNKTRKGILACGTGIGASIAANKIPGIRAALVCSAKDARLSIQHNNANILVLGGRPFDQDIISRIINTWLASEFRGGRHLRRLRKISRLEKRYLNV
jgi:ribose 5-phosphate isomerase B